MPRRTLRAVIPAGDWQASAMRRAVAMASRGGTILSMMSAWETSSESLARRVILADLILEVVDELLALSGKNSYWAEREERAYDLRRRSPLESREPGVVLKCPSPFPRSTIHQWMTLAHHQQPRKTKIHQPCLQIPTWSQSE
jgi:hypothetical protein